MNTTLKAFFFFLATTIALPLFATEAPWEPQPTTSTIVRQLDTSYGSGWQFSSQKGESARIVKKLSPDKFAGRNIIVEATMRIDEWKGGLFSVGVEYRTAEGKTETFLLRRSASAGTASLPWIRSIREKTLPEGITECSLFAGVQNANGSVTFVNIRAFPDRPVTDIPVTIRDNSRFHYHTFPNGIEAFRRNSKLIFRFPLLDDTVFAPTSEETARGFVPFLPEEVREVAPGRKIHRSEVISSLLIRSTPGQSQECFLAIGALRELKNVSVTIGELKRNDGRQLPPSVFTPKIAELMHIMWGRDYYRLVPRPQYPIHAVPISPDCPRLFNLLSKLPEDVEPGLYKGKVIIKADGKTIVLPFNYEVLPFKLVKGRPYMFCFYHRRNPELEWFKDMRDHGANSVYFGDAGVKASMKDGKLVMDFTESDRLIDLYRKSGMTETIVYNPFHDRLASRVLEILNLDKNYPRISAYHENHYVVPKGEYPPEAEKLYKEITRQVLEHARKANYPPMLLHPIDEPDEQIDQPPEFRKMNAYRGYYAKMEFGFVKQVDPTVKIFSTAYKLPIIERLRPELDVGCAEITRISREDAIRFRETVHNWGQPFWGMDWPAWWDDVARTRLACGFIPADRKLEAFMIWVYYAPHLHDPEYVADDFHGGYQRSNYSYVDKKGRLLPTVVFEGIRAGSNDWRFTETLREMIGKLPKETAEAESKVLDEVLKDGQRTADQKRNYIIERILKLL